MFNINSLIFNIFKRSLKLKSAGILPEKPQTYIFESSLNPTTALITC